jgi:UDP-glucuronate 4-epimerase
MGEMARFVVTGAAGFVGSHLVERLLRDGHEVTAVDRRPAGPGLPAVQVADLLQADLAPVLDGADYVIHLAGQPGVRESWDRFPAYARGNIETTQRLLEALRGRPLYKFVLASTSSVYGEAPMPAQEEGPLLPISPYGATKLAAESLCALYGRTAGIPWVALRYFTVYGPRQREDMAFTRWLRAFLAGDPITLFGDGRQVRDFTYVEDAVEATVRAAVGPAAGLALNVGGGSPVPVREALELIEAIAGLPLHIEFLPAAPGDMRETRAATDRLERELGFVPSTPLARGLLRQWEWVAGAGS